MLLKKKKENKIFIPLLYYYFNDISSQWNCDCKLLSLSIYLPLFLLPLSLSFSHIQKNSGLHEKQKSILTSLIELSILSLQ